MLDKVIFPWYMTIKSREAQALYLQIKDSILDCLCGNFGILTWLVSKGSKPNDSLFFGG